MRFKRNDAMNRMRGWSQFEFFVVITVIGIILLVATTHYLNLAREGRRVGFELLAHNFTTAISMARVQWIINPQHQDQLSYADLNGQAIYVNANGWPVGTVPSVSEKVTVQNCQQLWSAMLQNPSPATVEGYSERGKSRYHISTTSRGHCRYEQVTEERERFFFDYVPTTGQVLIHVPPVENISRL